MKCDHCHNEYSEWSTNRQYLNNIFVRETKVCKWCYGVHSIYNAEKIKIQNRKFYNEIKEKALKILKQDKEK